MKNNKVSFNNFPLGYKIGFSVTMGLFVLNSVCAALNGAETNKSMTHANMLLGVPLLGMSAAIYLAGRDAAKTKNNNAIPPIKLTDHSSGEKHINPKFIKVICRE